MLLSVYPAAVFHSRAPAAGHLVTVCHLPASYHVITTFSTIPHSPILWHLYHFQSKLNSRSRRSPERETAHFQVRSQLISSDGRLLTVNRNFTVRMWGFSARPTLPCHCVIRSPKSTGTLWSSVMHSMTLCRGPTFRFCEVIQCFLHF